jgi:hypothetical protein
MSCADHAAALASAIGHQLGLGVEPRLHEVEAQLVHGIFGVARHILQLTFLHPPGHSSSSGAVSSICSSFTRGSFFRGSGADEGAAWLSRMMMSVDRHDGGGYGAERIEERPSELPRLDDDLIGMGAERAGAHAGGMVWYCGR